MKCPRRGGLLIEHESPPFGEVWIEILVMCFVECVDESPPFGEVWIEICCPALRYRPAWVTSLRGGVD